MALFRIAILLILASCVSAEPIPRISKQNGTYHLLVNGKPFLVLGAQVRNSSGWPSQLANIWPQMKALHVNTVEIPVYWEQVEPRRGEFEFSTVDEIVRQARSEGFRLVLLWFATWKNGQMDYAPEWVKRDTATYRRMRNRAGRARSRVCRRTVARTSTRTGMRSVLSCRI